MKLLSKTLLILYLLILLWLVLFKFSVDLSSLFDHQTRSLNLAPFANVSRDNLKDVIYNFVGFIPFGLLLGVNFKRAGLWRKLAFVFFFSFAAETIQFVFAIGRTDITDVITNTLGGFLGLALYGLSNKHVHYEKLDRGITVAGTALLTLFVLLLSVPFSHSLRHRPMHQAGERLPSQNFVAEDIKSP